MLLILSGHFFSSSSSYFSRNAIYAITPRTGRARVSRASRTNKFRKKKTKLTHKLVLPSFLGSQLLQSTVHYRKTFIFLRNETNTLRFEINRIREALLRKCYQTKNFFMFFWKPLISKIQFILLEVLSQNSSIISYQDTTIVNGKKDSVRHENSGLLQEL